MITLMNKNCLDVAFQVFDYITHDTYGGYWINLGYTGNPWIVSKYEKIQISDRSEWQQLTDIDLKTPRNKPGLPNA